MIVGVGAATAFMAAHARVLDRPSMVATSHERFVQIRSGGHRPHALALQFLDAAAETDVAAVADLARRGALIPSSGCLHVDGGLADEMMRPLDFAPYPDRPVRRMFDAGVVASELERLAHAQSDDGGWPSEWTSSRRSRRWSGEGGSPSAP